MKSIEIYDSEHEKTYHLMVEEDIYDEIVLRNNMVLAQNLLDRQQEKENYFAAYKLIHDTSIPSEKETPKSPNPTTETVDLDSANETQTLAQSGSLYEMESEVTASDNKMWSDEATKLLISLVKRYEKDFETGIKKYIWGKIAKELTEKCHQVFTYQQCDTKFKGLKNMYKQVKKHNEQSGNNWKFWKYYDLMDSILFCRPEINPQATCSSKVGLIINGRLSENLRMAGERNLEESAATETTEPSSFRSTFTRKRKISENAIERRHREKIARQDRYLDLLDRLTTAVEKSYKQNEEN